MVLNERHAKLQGVDRAAQGLEGPVLERVRLLHRLREGHGEAVAEEVEAKLRKELALLELAELADLEPLMQDYPEALDCILDEGELLLTDFWAVYQTDKDVRWRRESKLRAI